MRNVKNNFIYLLVIALPMLLWACGADSHGGPKYTQSNSTSRTMIVGSVFASAVSGANVSAKNTSGQTIAGPVTTDASGTYSIDIPTYSLASDLIIETDNGTFIDEATAIQAPAGKMGAYIKGGSLQAGSSVNITPTSSIIHGLVIM